VIVIGYLWRPPLTLLLLITGCSQKFPAVDDTPSTDSAAESADSGADDGADSDAGGPGGPGADDTGASFSGDVQWVTSGMGCFGDVQASFYTQTWDSAAAMVATVAHTAGDGWEESHPFPDGEARGDDSWRWELLMDIVLDSADQLAGETTLFSCADMESERFGWTLRVTAYSEGMSEIGCHVLGHDVSWFVSSGCTIYAP